MDPGIFVRGVQVSQSKKALTTYFFLVLSLFYRSQMVNFKEIYHFSRFQRGSNIFQGGPTFSRWWGGVGGSNYLFPIETHITCDFPGGVRTTNPPPPLDPHLSKTLRCCISLILLLNVSKCLNANSCWHLKIY